MPLPIRPPAPALRQPPAWLASASVGPASRPVLPLPNPVPAPVLVPAQARPALPGRPVPVPAPVPEWRRRPARPRLTGPALKVRTRVAAHDDAVEWCAFDPLTLEVVAAGRERRQVEALRAARAAAASHRPPSFDDLTTTEAALLLGVTAETVRSWDTRGHLYRITEPGDRPRYRLRDLLVAERATRTTGQLPGRPSKVPGRRW